MHPPKPVFAFAVGVTGHRPARLPEGAEARIRTQIGAALQALRAAGAASHARHHGSFARSGEQFLLVSGLAEGSDRIGAQEALAQEFQLAAALPFPASEYEKDFATEASKKDFRHLLAASVSTLQFEGDRADEGKSYEQAGVAMLDASDLLIAVWDGQPAAGRGGTTEIVYEAARRGMPILRIDPADGAMRLYWHEGIVHRGGPAYFETEFSTDTLKSLGHVMDRLVRPPHAGSEMTALGAYLKEHFRRWTFSFEFPLLMLLLGLRWMRLGDFRRTPPQTAAGQLAQHEIAPRPLLEAYAWADEIAVVFGQTFRGAFIANFFLSALVTISVVALSPPASFVEIVLVGLLIFNTSWGRRRRWHHLWIEAREIAERFRVAMPVYATGSRTPLPFGDAPTWTSWYVRAQLRQAGMRTAILDKAAVEQVRKSLRAFLQGQASYHLATARRFRALHARLWLLGFGFFIAAVVVCLISIFVEIATLHPGWMPDWLVATTKRYYSDTVHHWFIAMSAGFPAIAAASYGIRVIGEFDGAAARSERMRGQLIRLTHVLEQAGDLEDLRELSQRAAEVMLGDVASWRLVVESRELEMPG